MDFEALGLGDAYDYDMINLVSSDEEVVEEEPITAPLVKEEEDILMDHLEDGEEEAPTPSLEVQQEQQVHVGPTVSAILHSH